MAYEVRTEVFEGPFDLLLHLILKEQVDLYEVRLSRVVDAYLAELQRLQTDGALDLEVATEFLLIASTLIELKTRRLLPTPETVELDEELGLWEERDLLIARLLESTTFKAAAAAFERLEEAGARSVPRTAGLDERFADLAPDLLAGVTPEKLRAALRRALTPKPVPTVSLEHVTPVRTTVAEALEELCDELSREPIMTFRRLTSGLVDRLDVIVRFLAVLELCKQGRVDLDQSERFGDLRIMWLGGDGGDADDERFDPADLPVDAYEG